MVALSNAWQTVIGFLVIALLFPWAGCLEFHKQRRAETLTKAGTKSVKPPFPTTPATA
jgi:hypothetical protein